MVLKLIKMGRMVPMSREIPRAGNCVVDSCSRLSSKRIRAVVDQSRYPGQLEPAPGCLPSGSQSALTVGVSLGPSWSCRLAGVSRMPLAYPQLASMLRMEYRSSARTRGGLWRSCISAPGGGIVGQAACNHDCD